MSGPPGAVPPDLLEALAGSGLVLFAQDADLRYTWIHNAPPGFEAARIVGLTDEEAVPAVDGARLAELKRRVRDTGAPVRLEFAYATPGLERVYDITLLPRRTPDGGFAGILGAALDITAQARREAAIRLSEERFRSLTDASPLGVFLTDLDGRCSYTNPAMAAVLQAAEASLLGHGWSSHVHEEERPRFLAEWQAAASLGQQLYSETRFVTGTGAVAWLRTRAAPLRDGDGTLVGFVGTLENVTRQRMWTEQLELRAQEQESVARFAHLAITLPGLPELMQHAAELVAGTLRVDFVKLLELTVDGRELVLRGAVGLPATLVGVARTPAGMDTPAGASLASDEPIVVGDYAHDTRFRYPALLRDQGAVSGLSVAVRGHHRNWGSLGAHTTRLRQFTRDDINFLRAIAGVLSAAVARHEAAVERQRLEAQIQHAQKLESLGVLAGGIAHDFNNLLVGILGNAGLALMDLPPESPARHPVRQIEVAAQRSAELTRQMLAYSGKGKFVVEPLDLSRCVEEMATLLQSVISRRALLRFDFAPGLPLVEGDGSQVGQIVMNLITNASDAIGDRSGIINVRTGVQQVDAAYLAGSLVDGAQREGLYAYIEVSDTGTGMDQATLARIFDPFFSTKFTGRGLGLAAVLGIVRGHGGAIRVYSEPGRGSTFKVLFPVKGELAPRERGPAGGTGPWRGQGAILVADDEETVRVVTAETLRRLGFEPIEAADGREAIEQFARYRDRIRAVLLDLTMPRLGGAEAFREIRTLRPDLPVILMSGYSEATVSGEFAGKGLAAFLQKPFGPERLAEVLRGVVGGDRGGDGGRSDGGRSDGRSSDGR